MCLVQTPLGKSNDSQGGCDPILCANRGRAEKAKPTLVVPVVRTGKGTTSIPRLYLRLHSVCEMHFPGTPAP